MNYEILKKKNYLIVYRKLLKNKWIICCLCVNWCENCRKYQKKFLELSKQYKQYYFLWIDIEENENFFENLENNTFPILLIQYKKKIIFFGNINPNIYQTKIIIKNLQIKNNKELKKIIEKNNIIYNWQQYNLLNYFIKK